MTCFWWGSGSRTKWLHWLTRCGPQPVQRISASWYRPMHHLGPCALLMLCCSSFLAYTPRLGLLHCFCCCFIHLELSTCWHSTVWKHSHFQIPLENPSIQTHLVLLCCIKRLCIFGPKGAIQIRNYFYYYFYYYSHSHWFWFCGRRHGWRVIPWHRRSSSTFISMTRCWLKTERWRRSVSVFSNSSTTFATASTGPASSRRWVILTRCPRKERSCIAQNASSPWSCLV